MELSSASHVARVASRPWRDGHVRMTDVAMPGTLRRFVRSRADLVTGFVMLGSLAVTPAGAVAPGLEGPTWRGPPVRAAAARPVDPGDPRYQTDLAGLLLDQGELAPAVERLRQAVRLRPRSAEIRLLLATAFRRAGDYDGMVREYTKVRRLAPSNPLGEIARQALNERGVR